MLMQVRLGSTRLPRKAVLPLADRTVVEHAMIALRAVDVDRFALVTDRQSADTLAAFAARCGYELFVGDPENVLKRYRDAAVQYHLRTVIRATGDNPVVSGALAGAALRLHRERAADLTRFDGLPLGCGVEVVECDALERALGAGPDPYEQEHVTAYLYRHADNFRVAVVSVDERFRSPRCRVTLDTQEDYRALQQLFAARYHGEPMEIEQIIQWCNEQPGELACE